MLKRAFDKRIKEISSEWMDMQPALLGTSDQIVVTSEQGMYYARLISGKLIKVYNQAHVPPTYDLRVVIGRRRTLPNVWQIIHVEEVYTVPAAQNEIEYHAKQHELGGGDQVFLDHRQIVQLSVRVYDSVNFIVTVFGAIVKTATGIKKIETQSIDVSSYVVTTGAKIITIESNDNGVLSINEGTPFSAAAAAIASDIPAPSAGKYPIAGILLYEGQSTLSDEDIFPIVAPPGNSSSSSSNVFQRNLSADLTLNDGECIVIAGYINVGTYILTTNGDSIVKVV